jgi:signal transduction histidine kinase
MDAAPGSQGTDRAGPAAHGRGVPPALSPSGDAIDPADLLAPDRLPPPRAGPRALGTRGRLVVAFAALAVALGAGFAVGAMKLASMEWQLAELLDHHDEIQLALELEQAVRETLEREARILAGEQAPPAVSGERTGPLLRELQARVDEPPAIALVTRIAATVGELDARFRAERAGVAAEGDPPAADERLRLALQVEESVNGLVTVLRDVSARHSASVERLRRDSVRLALAFAVAMALFAVAVGFYLSRSIARPLKALGDGATRIAEGGLDTRIAVQGPEEFVALADKFNAMASDLASHQEQLVRSEKLASLGRLAAGIAHEINNPLQVILGYLTLPRGPVDRELATYLDRVEREARRCKEIVDALKQLSAPAVMEAREPVDLRAVAEEVAEALRIATPDAPPVRIHGEGEALGRPAPLRQVIFNLVENAADAAGSSGHVEVEITPGTTARVVVSDTGEGIPAELRDRLFEPFFTTKPAGTGLGLALARAIAQAYGGDVELEPEASASRGTRFTLFLPGCPHRTCA